ncbi:MAG: hypothetical protein J3Q66DRAFT_438547 [Benniella sp.]|nr:MAG: hypothetical protein J3Q66DRAFT_438547 [Benniella sp.]
MLFSSIVSSPRATLSPLKALELANVYLETAFNASDSDITLVLCHDTEVSLSQARKSVKHDKNPTVIQGVATAYIGLGKLLESRGHVSGAQASFKKAEKLGGKIDDLNRLTDTYRPNSIMESLKGTLHSAGGSQDMGSAKLPLPDQQQCSNVSAVAFTFPPHIFAENIPLPTIKVKLPGPDERLDNTPQLVCCLALLKVAQSADIKLEPTALIWTQAVEKDKDEQERLYGIATDVIRAFKREEIKDAKVVAEVVRLAPILDKNMFHDLLGEFYSGIDNSGLLKFQQLEGLAQLIQGADHGYLSSDDLVKILGLLSARLMDTHQQSSQHMYQLTLAVSHVLDAMADTKVTDLNREKLHEPLSSYLSGLKKSSDPFLVYQAAYAYQALLCVPDDETTWQAAMRRTGKVVQGVSGLVSAVKGLDLVKFMAGLENIQKGVSGISNIVDVAMSAYDGVTSLMAGGQGLMDSLKEGLSFERKRDWYSALRGADALIRDGELATFRKLVCEVPCRYDPAFQWGVCQRLGEMAANPKWDAVTRRGAIAFIGEIYRNEEMWGQRTSTKQWILNILMQLSKSSGESSQLHSTAAETLLRELEVDDDIKKRALYRACLENGSISYPLKVTLPKPASPSLLDRVQNKPDVEGHLRILKRQRTKERGNAVYIQPQARASLQAADDTRFPLMDNVKEFLGSDQKVFLLLGDSGAGKSTFTRELEFDLWQSYTTKKGRIPIHINLPAIDKPELDMIAKQLRRDEFTEPQIREMKQHRKFVLICDGYDESQQTHNLYMSNRLNQPGEWDAQMVISCRSEYLGSDYRDRFQPGNRNQQLDSPLFQQAVITPFSIHQIHDYIKQYVSVNETLWREEDYKQALDLIPSLKDLVKNPFLMTLSLDVLPRMVDPGKHLTSARVTRVALYDHFVEQWLERGKKRLSEKDMSSFTRETFEKLSAEGFTLNGIEYLKMFSAAIYKEQGGQPVVEYSQLIDRGSWKEVFFSSREMQLLHEACPLTRSGNQHRFIHRSILEYGLSRAVFDPQDKRNRATLQPIMGRRGSVSAALRGVIYGGEKIVTMSEQEPDHNSPLVWRSFVNEHSLLQFLEERVQQEPVFKDQLLAYIERSKKDKQWSIAAANAITILVRAGMQFIGTDLRSVQIPGADLSYGVFDSVNLQDANIRMADLRGAWLRQTDLSRSDMTGVQFGEFPYLAVDDEVWSCAYSQDGSSFGVGLGNGNIHVYSTSDWEIIRTLNGHEDQVRGIAFSPDGGLLVSGSFDKTIRIWIVELEVCQHILTDHTDKLECVAYSPHGDQFASAGGDMIIRLWNPTTGNCCQILFGHENTVCYVVYSPKGDQVASGSDDSTVRLWNVVTGECTHTFDSHSDEVWGVAFSPQGNQVASSSKDKTIRLWDVELGICRHTLEGHNDGIGSVVYSLKGDQIFSGGRDGTVRVWDVQSGSCRHIMTGHGNAISYVAYSPKGDMVASGSTDNTVRLWDVSAGGSRYISSGHSQEVERVKCSPNGKLIASCSMDGTIRLWDIEAGTCQRTLSGHSDSVFGLAFSPQGDQIASGSYDRTARLWDVDAGTCQHILTGHTNTVWSIAYSPLQDQVASASEDHTVRLWNTTTGELCGTLDGHTDGVKGVAYSPDGSIIVTTSMDETVRLWDAGTMACINTLLGHSNWVTDVVFSPQGDQLASASSDWTVRLWIVATGECCLTLTAHNHAVGRVAYSHKGDLLASGSWDKTVRLWDVASGQCRAVIQNFQGGVLGVAWTPSPDANFLITGCNDGSVLKWQVIEGDGQCHVNLCWTVTSGSLAVTGASIQDVHGLTALSKQLLKQRGVVGEPGSLFREASKKLVAMTSVVSHMKQLSDKMVPDPPSIINLPDEQAQQQDERQDEWQDEQQVNSKSRKRRYRRIVRHVRR